MIEESPQRRTRAAMVVGFRDRATDVNVTAALAVCHERWLVGFDELVKICETHLAGDVRHQDQWLALWPPSVWGLGTWFLELPHLF